MICLLSEVYNTHARTHAHTHTHTRTHTHYLVSHAAHAYTHIHPSAVNVFQSVNNSILILVVKIKVKVSVNKFIFLIQ